MILDIEMLRSFYASYSDSVKQAKATVKRPLTYAEKVLFAHLYDPTQLRPYKRGIEYVDFRPNRVAMQDATAQMALLQFMNAGQHVYRICTAHTYCYHTETSGIGRMRVGSYHHTTREGIILEHHLMDDSSSWAPEANMIFL